MSESKVAEAAREIVLRHARIKVPTLRPDHRLARDLGFDSLAYLLTVSDLEDRLGFVFPLERVDSLREATFAEVVQFLEGLVLEQPAPRVAEVG